MRGEYRVTLDSISDAEELPPRARRILIGKLLEAWIPGTTSACAENTKCGGKYPASKRNYLRVRGEYILGKVCHFPCLELPPRARRIRAVALQHGMVAGTTSACAENTDAELWAIGPDWNYLRVRGEYAVASASHNPWWELPPRARRILNAGRGQGGEPGTTSACAENTGTPRGWSPK